MYFEKQSFVKSICVNIFYRSVGFICVFFTLSFAEHTFIIWMKSSLLTIPFMDCIFDGVFEKSVPYPMWSRISSVLFSRSLIGFHFTFTCTIYFELIFVKTIKPVSRSTFVFACVVPAAFVEETTFAPLDYLVFFFLNQLTVVMKTYFWAL